jgi:hypothetical protein
MKMKRTIILTITLLAAQPTMACHIHKIWRYPWPQKCGSTIPSLHIEIPSTVRTQPKFEIPDICTHVGDYNPREYGLCRLRYELKVYIANEQEETNKSKIK